METDVVIACLMVVLLICVGIGLLLAFVLVAGFVATSLGLSGVLWWAMAIVVFLILTGIVGLLARL